LLRAIGDVRPYFYAFKRVLLWAAFCGRETAAPRLSLSGSKSVIARRRPSVQVEEAMGNVWQSLKQWFGILWLRLKQLYVFLLPLRFSFLALGILVFAFRFSDQGTDILRALAGEDA